MSAYIKLLSKNDYRTRPLGRLITGPWPIVAISGLAFLLRMINLAQRPMWYDEAFAVLYSEKSLGTMLYGTVTRVQGAAADVHPLFFYSMLHFWMQLLGQSPVAVRLLSVLLGTATVFIAYLLAKRLYGTKVALAAALIVAVAPFHIYYSQEARMYALLGFAAMSMTYFFVRAWTEGGRASWIGFGICGALTLYAHNLGIMFLAGLDAWVLWAWYRSQADRRRTLLPHLLAHLLMLVLFAPWLAVLPSQFGKIQQAYWVEQPGIVKLIQTLLIFHFSYDNQSLPGWLLPVALFFSLFILAVVILEYTRVLRRSPVMQGETEVQDSSSGVGPSGGASGEPAGSYQMGYSFLLVLSLAPILFTFVVSQVRPVYIVRALLPSALAYYVLIAGLLVSRRVPKAVQFGLLVPSVLIVAVSLANHYTYSLFPRSPFDQVAAYLGAHAEPTDVIIHSNKLTFLPTYYYDRSLPQEFIGDEPGSPSDTLAYPTQQALGLFSIPDIATAAGGHDRVWLVIFDRAIDEYRLAGYATHPHLIWLDSSYVRVGQMTWGDLHLFLYEK
jgi:mannosyltransferase